MSDETINTVEIQEPFYILGGLIVSSKKVIK